MHGEKKIKKMAVWMGPLTAMEEEELHSLRVSNPSEDAFLFVPSSD